ncbi:hypothetical protein H920_01019 [Fukomys damarensis]|uniref:Uncharacterized protein n=1 Tax=Fukomys damarensis TaxID=885580 RepID=A0A091DZI0_FUKDA|nr:hypothetical protein H920_01019 [Fukomys damarensis]
MGSPCGVRVTAPQWLPLNDRQGQHCPLCFKSQCENMGGPVRLGQASGQNNTGLNAGPHRTLGSGDWSLTAGVSTRLHNFRKFWDLVSSSAGMRLCPPEVFPKVKLSMKGKLLSTQDIRAATTRQLKTLTSVDFQNHHIKWKNSGIGSYFEKLMSTLHARSGDGHALNLCGPSRARCPLRSFPSVQVGAWPRNLSPCWTWSLPDWSDLRPALAGTSRPILPRTPSRALNGDGGLTSHAAAHPGAVTAEGIAGLLQCPPSNPESSQGRAALVKPDGALSLCVQPCSPILAGGSTCSLSLGWHPALPSSFRNCPPVGDQITQALTGASGIPVRGTDVSQDTEPLSSNFSPPELGETDSASCVSSPEGLFLQPEGTGITGAGMGWSAPRSTPDRPFVSRHPHPSHPLDTTVLPALQTAREQERGHGECPGFLDGR